MTGLCIAYFCYAFGLAYILGQSVISRPLREWAYNFSPLRISFVRWLVLLVECPACCGFWIGFFTADFVKMYLGGGGWSWFQNFLFAMAVGCVTSGSNYIIGRATGVIPIPHKEEEEK